MTVLVFLPFILILALLIYYVHQALQKYLKKPEQKPADGVIYIV